MNTISPSLDEAKKYRKDLAKKLNHQKLLTSNKITKLLVKKSPEEILEVEKNKTEYVESTSIVRENQKNYREEKQEKEKIERIINRIIENKSEELRKLSPEETQKIKEYLNNPDNKSNFIDKYIALNLKKKEEEEEERLKNTRRYNSGHDFHDRAEPTPIESTLYGLGRCGYINFNQDTAKILIDKGYGENLVNRFFLFDKEGQKYLIGYYMKNRKNWYPDRFIDSDAIKLQVLNNIYERNAEYGHDSNYQNILKDLLSYASSRIVADEIKGISDEWVAREGKIRNSRHSDSIRSDVRNLAYRIKHDNYKGFGFLRIGHLIEGEKVIAYLETNGTFEKIAKISDNELEEIKRQIRESFN